MGNKSGNPTLADVASLAGVSKGAAWAVLERPEGSTVRVGAKTAAAIRAAAEKLNYHGNATARALASGRTGNFGFLLSSSVERGWANPYFASYLPGAENACRARGLGLCIASAPLADASRFITSPILVERRVDALIVAGELEPESYRALEAHHLPYLVLGASPHLPLPVIDPLPQITYLRHLAGRGHRRILVTRDRPQQPLGSRVDEEVERLGRDGVTVEWCVPPEGMHPNWECGHGLGSWLFEHWRSRRQQLGACVVVSNSVLLEFYGELARSGLACPRDVQLFGDNHPDFSQAMPRFACVRVDQGMVAAEAVRILHEAVEEGRMVDREVCASVSVNVEVLPGETCA